MVQRLIENTSVAMKNGKFRACRPRIYDENDRLHAISPELVAVDFKYIMCLRKRKRKSCRK